MAAAESAPQAGSQAAQAAGQAAAIAATLRQLIADAAKAFVIEVTANLIELTPVDTKHARANWVPAVGEPYTGEDPGAAGEAQAAGIAAVLRYKLGDGPLSISNNVPYIKYLIAGSSSQRPAGWDLVAIARAIETIQAQYDIDIDVTDGPKGPVVTFRGPVGG